MPSIHPRHLGALGLHRTRFRPNARPCIGRSATPPRPPTPSTRPGRELARTHDERSLEPVTRSNRSARRSRSVPRRTFRRPQPALMHARRTGRHVRLAT
jgi:hypothetical protein